MNSSTHVLKAVRGATSLAVDTPGALREETVRLLDEIMERNGIDEADIVNIFFTLTSDLQAANPARAVREHYDWPLMPMLCSQEPFIEGHHLPRCVRVMVQFYGPRKSQRPQPVYLNKARELRPELA